MLNKKRGDETLVNVLLISYSQSEKSSVRFSFVMSAKTMRTL